MNLSRRRLLVRSGAWLGAWPLWHYTRAHGQVDRVPKRVVIVFSPNGPIMARGPASGTETDFQVHDWWKPLERHKADGFFFAGTYQAGVPYGEHNEFGHQSAGTGALTARTTEGTNNSTGPSLDQFIGQELQRQGVVTPKRSLLWGTHTEVGNWGPWYEGAGKPVNVNNDPFLALEDLLPILPTGDGPPIVDRELQRKHFVLDHVYGDCKALASRLGADGKEVLDFHCQNIESLELSVAKALENPPRLSCEAPTDLGIDIGADADFGDPENFDQAMEAFVELTALAFTCDVTRVIGVSFGGTAARNRIPSSYGVPSAAQVDSGDSGPAHHPWTHIYDESEEKRFALQTFTSWYAERVALLIDKLKATVDANGESLFDSTLVLWTSELGTAGPLEPHPNQNIPVLLFGTSQGAFLPGRFHDGDGRHESGAALVLHQLFVSMIQHAGLTNVETFGNQGSGPLEWLLG